MRSIFILSLLVAASVVSASLSSDASNWLLRTRFEQFKKDFGKSYATKEEEDRRFGIFTQNLERSLLKNVEHKTDVFGVTKFSDLTQDEFRGFLNFNPRKTTVDPRIPVSQPTKPLTTSSFDWRNEGVVTPVKNQGYCGSCWAFSATETIESAWAIAGNSLTEFSPEQIVQCDTYDYGCDGGWPTSAYEYVEDAGGMATEADYPYTSSLGVTGRCSSDFTISGGYVDGYSYATTPCTSVTCNSQNENLLRTNLADNQPVSVCVDASEWSDYTSGIFPTSSCSSGYYSLDHCVQLVGFTSTYYIVRNSWDTDWGVDGYIYLYVDVNACGIADMTTMVKIA